MSEHSSKYGVLATPNMGWIGKCYDTVFQGLLPCALHWFFPWESCDFRGNIAIHPCNAEYNINRALKVWLNLMAQVIRALRPLGLVDTNWIRHTYQCFQLKTVATAGCRVMRSRTGGGKSLHICTCEPQATIISCVTTRFVNMGGAFDIAPAV